MVSALLWMALGGALNGVTLLVAWKPWRCSADAHAAIANSEFDRGYRRGRNDALAPFTASSTPYEEPDGCDFWQQNGCSYEEGHDGPHSFTRGDR